ncbi:hypothetical protein VTI28DRAFT_5136 [Corynascus sepedonium]
MTRRLRRHRKRNRACLNSKAPSTSNDSIRRGKLRLRDATASDCRIRIFSPRCQRSFRDAAPLQRNQALPASQN